MNKIRILIVDDHPLMRSALREVIETEIDMEIVGEAVNGIHAVDLAEKLKPDVVLMDLNMPVMDGIEATKLIISTNPTIKVLTLTSLNAGEKVIASIKAGSIGYMLKDSTREIIIFGIREVSIGHRYIPSEIGAKLAFALQSESDMIQSLTKREYKVLLLVGDGLQNNEIAKSLAISENTVRVHISKIIQKYNLESRSQLALWAQRNKARI